MKPIVKKDAVVCFHPVTGCKFSFTQHVNPRNTEQCFFVCSRSPIGGEARTLDYIKSKFVNLTFNLWSA